MSTMDIQKQSTKFIKPATKTPPTLHHHKIGFIDESVPPFNINVVFFYSADSNDNHLNFVSHLEKSLEKTLPRFYPLAGRYVEQDRVIDCLDQGVEFIHAKVTNIKFKDIVGSEENLKLVDELIPSALGAVDEVTDPLLSIQLTTFDSGGGVALGVSISHRVGDTATLFIFLNEWAAISRGESQTDFPPGSGFNTASFFPARGSSPPKLFPRTKSSDNLYRSKYVTKKLSFSESEISNFKNKMMVGSEQQQYFSKVQLVSAFIWKALSDIDQRTNGGYPPRCCVLLWAINLRGKSTSLIPSDSCGNLSTAVAAKCETNDETVESLARLVRKSVKDFMDSYSKVRDDKEQVQTMVIKSCSDAAVIPPKSTVIRLTSWCKFPYYQLDFGFGKPIWVNRGRAIGKNVVYLMDDAGGNGVEAYVGVEDNDVPYFEESLSTSKIRFAT